MVELNRTDRSAGEDRLRRFADASAKIMVALRSAAYFADNSYLLGILDAAALVQCGGVTAAVGESDCVTLRAFRTARR
jgi:hypothetical protein